jgi:predicted GNAT family acetyltransferase
VTQLVHRGWSFARIEDGRVVFKAEVAAASPYAAQVQGVYVDPSRRGEGLAAAGMAAVVRMALADIAPVVSLYVNDHNVAARRAYARVGFEQTALFTTVMF